MSARIRIYGQEAVFSQGQWTCADESLQAMLEALADPRAMTEEQEREHALYAAGRYGGLIATNLGWEAAPHPEAEIKLEDFQPRREPKKAGGGLLGGLFRRKG
ncbi:hypothetical protein E7T09_13735 [Deinococcus sp. KSM4-11]|uniref:hypothetical protein n=1 Tax=Deinococcus sp. KSM4-11 TaxID=2568654 RepID=UPI0010A37C46|nr:hypothetical protein [Deinococcus sp. KSM4-11]THF86261.1 hypothetical protein E7T09_13735 [Deinococcus sp. KSM4-11]